MKQFVRSSNRWLKFGESRYHECPSSALFLLHHFEPPFSRSCILPSFNLVSVLFRLKVTDTSCELNARQMKKIHTRVFASVEAVFQSSWCKWRMQVQASSLLPNSFGNLDPAAGMPDYLSKVLIWSGLLELTDAQNAAWLYDQNNRSTLIKESDNFS